MPRFYKFNNDKSAVNIDHIVSIQVEYSDHAKKFAVILHTTGNERVLDLFKTAQEAKDFMEEVIIEAK